MGRNFDRAVSTPFGDALAYNNLVINGGQEVSQENGATQLTLVNNTAKYVTDQWQAYYSHAAATAVFKAQQVTPPGSPSFGAAFPSCLQLTATTLSAMAGSGDFATIRTPIEGYRMAKLGFGNAAASSQYVTIGFWVYATVAGVATATVVNGLGSRSYVSNVIVNSPLTWEYKTITVPGDIAGTWDKTNGVGAYIYFCFGAGTNYLGSPNVWNTSLFLTTVSTTNFFASNNNTVCITGVSIMPGTEGVPAARSPFAIRPFDQEVLLCQRYWEKSYDYATALGTITTNGSIWAYLQLNTTVVSGGGNFTSYKATKRAAPTVTLYSTTTGTGGKIRDNVNGADVTANINLTTPHGFQWYANLFATAGALNATAQFSADARL